MSKPHARFAPSLSWTTHAVAGNTMSGVTVATTRRSISAGGTPRRSGALRAARTASSLVGVPGSTTWRCSMPVRVRIHSSDVSTIRSKSAFVMTRSGTYVPRAVMRARLWLIVVPWRRVIRTGPGEPGQGLAHGGGQSIVVRLDEGAQGGGD